MARIVLNNRYSQLVNVSIKEADTEKSLGSIVAYRDPRTGITKFQWILGSTSINDMNFVTLGSVGYKPEAEFFSRVNFYVDNFMANVVTIDGQPFYPKVMLRNPAGFSFNGMSLNGYLQLSFLNNDTKAPTELFYSVCVEAAFT